MAVGETVALSLATKVIERAAPSLIERIGSKLTFAVDKTRVQFTKTFQKHIAWSIQKSRYAKTIVSKEKPIELSNIYVPLTLTCEDQIDIPEDSINPTSQFGMRCVLSGTGGAGKTFLVKHLVNRSIDNANGMVPLLIELRSLNFSSEKSLEEIIMADLWTDGATESLSLFKCGLEEGIFAIFFDGFDEISPEHSDKALVLITKFSRLYPGYFYSYF